jgi:prepilin-type N-terminal cleavage/methylation domain-containing protein
VRATEQLSILPASCRGVCLKRLSNKSGARRDERRYNTAFTLVELLVVMSIILILVGLILVTVGYVKKKGATSRAAAEIAALSAALESYKADNGIYPRNTDTDALAPNSDPAGGNPTQAAFQNASLYLYKELSGDHDANRTVDATDDLSGGVVVPKTYFTFRPNNLLPAPPSTTTVIAISDPFGNSYGYSTLESANSGSANGNNPTFDLWSTAGETGKKTNPPETFQQYQQRWIKNW